MTKARVKEIKRMASENITEVGYSHSIFKSVDVQEMLFDVYDMLSEMGYDLGNESDFRDMALSRYIERSNYQEFKNNLLPHLLAK